MMSFLYFLPSVVYHIYLGPTCDKSCNMYDKTSNEWILLANMKTSRCYSASALINGSLWIAGGWNGHVDLNSTEYVFPNGVVTKGPDMPTTRASHCMVTLEDGKVKTLIITRFFIEYF